MQFSKQKWNCHSTYGSPKRNDSIQSLQHLVNLLTAYRFAPWFTCQRIHANSSLHFITNFSLSLLRSHVLECHLGCLRVQQKSWRVGNDEKADEDLLRSSHVRSLFKIIAKLLSVDWIQRQGKKALLLWVLYSLQSSSLRDLYAACTFWTVQPQPFKISSMMWEREHTERAIIRTIIMSFEKEKNLDSISCL